jgi:hypothetical protein
LGAETQDAFGFLRFGVSGGVTGADEDFVSGSSTADNE